MGPWGHEFNNSTSYASLLKLGQFRLPLFASVYSAVNEYSTKIVRKIPAMDQRTVQEGEYISTLSCMHALNKTRFKHCLQGFLRQSAWGITLLLS